MHNTTFYLLGTSCNKTLYFEFNWEQYFLYMVIFVVACWKVTSGVAMILGPNPLTVYILLLFHIDLFFEPGGSLQSYIKL